MESILGIEFNKWIIVYIVAVVLGFLFRVGIVSPLVSSAEDSKKRTFRQIIVVIILTVFWSVASEEIVTKNIMAGIALTIFYIGYVLSKKAGKDGYIHSFLVFISGYFITAMSFMTFPANLIMGIITIALAIIVYRRFESERRSTFWEIIIMVVEAIAISFLVWLMKWTNAFSTVLVVLFVETTIYSINIFIGYCIVLACNEDVYEYINSIKGLDGF